jgi:hypothetical protein
MEGFTKHYTRDEINRVNQSSSIGLIIRQQEPKALETPVAPLAKLDLMLVKDWFGNFAGTSRSRPHDCYHRSRSVQPGLFDCGLPLQVYQ